MSRISKEPLALLEVSFMAGHLEMLPTGLIIMTLFFVEKSRCCVEVATVTRKSVLSSP
jgi:hypothetical protein